MEKIIDLDEAKKRILDCMSLKELNDLRVFYLGKKSILNQSMSKMGELSQDERIAFGKYVNTLKQDLNDFLEEQKNNLETIELNERLQNETIDISLDGDDFSSASYGIIGSIVDEICNIGIGIGFSIAEGPEVENNHYNFEMLNLPKDHPARDMQDTFYINDNDLLRSQTSPVQVRTLLSHNGEGPVKILCPGKVYRRDDDDATHSHQFTQIEGLVVDKNITMSDLKGILLLFARKMFGEKRTIRLRSSFFPFTEPSVEVDVSCYNCNGKGCSVCKDSGWIEILGAGMVHPNVLKMSGFDPKIYQGYAFGVGVERIAMLRYGIDDLRHIYSNDIRVLSQFKKER